MLRYHELPMDDASLVRAALEGSTSAFADIYDRYGSRIYSFLCSIMRNREDAADALQDTFLAAGSRLGQLKDPEKLRPWLFAIARHTAMRSLGRSKRTDSLEDVEVTDTSAGPAEVAAQNELAQLVADCSGGLSDRDRVLLDLHLRQGLEGQELGLAIGVGAGHAHVLLSRMRDQVERSMGALLVARQGRSDCRDLRGVLSGWDGRFTMVWRKRVARHIDHCAKCDSLRKKIVTPFSMLSTLPLFEAPGDLRGRILEQVQLTGSSSSIGDGRGYRAGKDGFPPPMIAKASGKQGLAGLAAVLLLLLAVPSIYAAGRTLPAPVQSPAKSAPLEFNPEVLKPAPTMATIETPGGPALLAPARPSPPAIVDPGPDPSAASPPVPTSPPTSPPPSADRTDPALDLTDPALGSLRITPAQIWASGSCGAGRPQTAIVTVRSSDPSGIKRVVMSFGGRAPGSRPMAGTNGTYSATLGPFAPAAVPPAGSTTVPLTIRSTDNAGNGATISGAIRLSCEAPAGRVIAPPPPAPG